jgi:hypothetical protein
MLLATLPFDPALAADEPPIGLVIVTPPGIELGKDGARYVDELVTLVSKSMGLGPGELVGFAFSDPSAAAQKIASMPDGFVLGSLGFFTAHRTALGLRPLLAIERADAEPESYRVVVKKGRFETLASLAGKRLAGSPLYEAPRFIDVAAFDGALTAATHFVLKPTTRPLREVRGLASDKVDAVLLDAAQFASLKALPLFESLAVVHTSQPIPSLGLMARDSERSKALGPKMIEAAQALCAHGEGQSLCKSFGIAGFDKVDQAAIDGFVKKLEQ